MDRTGTTARTDDPLRALPALGRARWWGAGAGLALALVDTLTIAALGVTFELNGRDVSLLVAGFFGSSLAIMGFLLGWVIEGRRRDRQAAAVIRAQMETISAARARLVQSEKLAALGQLSAAIAHEVRNPLAVIRSAAQSLAEELPQTDTAAHRACSFITAEIDRLTAVVTSLLDFVRPLRVEARPLAVRELFAGALLLAGDELGAKGVRVEQRLPPDLPLVQADPELLRQVLIGLLSNAVEAVPRGGEVRLGARAADGALELEVADSGPGVPPTERARIFEPFVTTRARGTGLGLAIAKQIVEAHGGRITVGERAGGGARFLVRLPAASGAAIAA